MRSRMIFSALVQARLEGLHKMYWTGSVASEFLRATSRSFKQVGAMGVGTAVANRVEVATMEGRFALRRRNGCRILRDRPTIKTFRAAICVRMIGSAVATVMRLIDMLAETSNT